MTKDEILRNVRYYRKCWEWKGKHDRNHGKAVYEHAYELWKGPIPEGKQIDHTCGNGPRCVNPKHLKPVSRSMNVRLAHRRRRGQMPARDLRIATWCHDTVLVKLQNAYIERLESVP